MAQTISRTKNSIHNTFWGAVFFILKMLLQFVVRAIFIRFLGKELLGLNGLFTNVLNMLSLAELGIGNAIVYSMYNPIAEGDVEKTKSLLRVYRNVYLCIGTVVVVVGLGLLPALPYLIKDTPDTSFNINILYVIYLAHSVIGYFFAYRRALVFAAQRNDIENKVGIISQLVMAVAQIIVMVTIKNYYYYAGALFLGSVIDAVTVFAISYKLFPEMRGKAQKLPREDVKIIAKNSAAKFAQAIGWNVVFSTDSLIISGFLGLGILGIYSNYTLIMTSLISVVNIFCTAIKGSVGNLMASADKEKVYEIFRALSFALFWLLGFLFIGLVCCYQDFMLVFAGSNEYLLPFITVLLLCLQFYFRVSRYMVELFKDCAGLFWNDWFRPLLEAGINIVLDFLLLWLIGLNGVVLATIISIVGVSLGIETYVLFKNYFKMRMGRYFIRYTIYTVLIFAVCAVTYLICYFIPSGKVWFFVKFAICLIVPNLLFLLLSFKTQEFKYIISRILKIIFPKRNAKNNGQALKETEETEEVMDELNLKKLQQVETEILVIVDEFCREHEIEYSLYAGTALGAVRHKGFIPWDDDIDICMTRENYNKFLNAWRENPIQGFTLAGDDEKNCKINHSKILKDGTILSSKEDMEKPVHHGIWLDVFAIDKIPTAKRARKKFMFWAKIRLVYTRGYPLKNRGKALEFLSRLMLLLPKKLQRKLKAKSDKKLFKYGNLETDYELIGLAAPNELKTIYPSNVMDEFELISFEGHMVSISSQFDLMLKLKFGDYMQLPPEEERVCKHNPEVIKFD